MKKFTKTPTVSIVIPNWNGVYLMEKHLQKVIDNAPGAEIVVADDMSTDGSVDYLRKNFPKVVVVERNKREGFAANVNAGVAKATGDIVILLNTDVEPEKGFLKPLLTHFENPDMFAVGCLEKSPEASGVVLRGRGLAKWTKGFFVHSKGEVDGTTTAWVSGGSGAFRRAMWNKLGGMDVLYNPFYWEDIDLSYRARKAGWKIVFEPTSVVNHYHEEGKIKREFTPTDVKRIVYRNQFIFIWKNLSDMNILVSHIFWTPIRLVQATMSGDTLMIQGYIRAMSMLPRISNTRKKQSVLWKQSDTTLDVV
jgi:GT2 family glycosyltransferase